MMMPHAGAHAELVMSSRGAVCPEEPVRALASNLTTASS
jgi:hypothetical protein